MDDQKYLPRVSIIVPVYNGERTLPTLIESLRKLDYPEEKFEILIVDNMSIDNSAELIRESGFTFLSEDKIQGASAARNRGLREAGGDLIGFTDSDCVVDSCWVIEAVKGFDRENIGAVAGRIKGYTPTNYIEKYLADIDFFNAKTALNDSFLPFAATANVFYRRKVFDSIGLFETWIEPAEDKDVSWRMQLETDYRFGYREQALVWHIHRSNLRSLFRQLYFWGQGRTALYIKYHPGGRRTIRIILKDYLHVVYSIIKAMRSILRGRLRSPETIEAVMSIARKLGNIRGTIRHGGGHW